MLYYSDKVYDETKPYNIHTTSHDGKVYEYIIVNSRYLILIPSKTHKNYYSVADCSLSFFPYL